MDEPAVTLVQPPALAPPVANYSHAVLSRAGNRLLHTSGVVPARADGTVPSTIAEQAETVWHNLAAILAAADMGASDVVSVTTYVVAGHDLAAVMAARDRAMAGHRPASTLVVVPALARPEWQVEISLVASAP